MRDSSALVWGTDLPRKPIELDSLPLPNSKMPVLHFNDKASEFSSTRIARKLDLGNFNNNYLVG